MSKRQSFYYTIVLSLLCVILIFGIFNWSDYLVQHFYLIGNGTIRENLQDMGTSDTSHTVDIPLTTTTMCRNMCGPQARCYLTGQQCTSDIDCPGCQPNSPPLKLENTHIPGDDDAGKLTFGTTPQYSTLTTDIGTQARLITDNKFSKPYAPNLGENTWMKKFNKDKQQYDNRYGVKNLPNMPTYDKRYSLSGQFIDDGPLASNAYLE